MICSANHYYQQPTILSHTPRAPLGAPNPSEVHGHQVAVREKGASVTQRGRTSVVSVVYTTLGCGKKEMFMVSG